MKNIASRVDWSAFLILCFALTLASSDSTWAEAPDPEAWYRDQYAPLWEDNPQAVADSVKPFYHSQIVLNEPCGRLAARDSAQWLDENVSIWVDEGWLGSNVSDLRVDRVNATSVTFTARWLDRYQERDDEYSCGWYAADVFDGQWQFTRYEDLDCDAQNFDMPDSTHVLSQ